MNAILSQSFNMRLAKTTDVAALRILVNDAYQELAELGMNYTGSYQDEATTRQRMQTSDVYLLESKNHLIATVSVRVTPKHAPSHPSSESCLYISQLAVTPTMKRQGLGRYLLKFCDELAMQRGLSLLQLDTAVPATHLIHLYETHGFKTVDEVQWEGKTYRSYIMEKKLTGLASCSESPKFATIAQGQRSLH